MAYTPKFDDEKIEALNKVYENLRTPKTPWTRKSEKSASITVDFGKEEYVELSKTLAKFSASFAATLKPEMTITETEKDSDEMASMTSGLASTKLSGVVMNSSMVTLDKDFNGAKSFKFPKEIDSSKFKVDEKVVVTFVGNKCTNIEKLVDCVDKTKNGEPVQRETRLNKNGFYLTPFQENVLKAVYKAVTESTENVVLNLVGAAGYGKTSIAEQYAANYDFPLLTIDCSTISDNQEHYIIPEFKAGETNFALTEFSKYLQMGKCVIILDEINRMPSWVSNSLLPVTDHRKATHLRGLDIKVANGITFFYTCNQGAEYTGTNPLDRALNARVMGTMLVDALPNDVEIELMEKRHYVNFDTATKIMSVMNKLRESLKDYPVNVSTRTSLFIAFWVRFGLSIRDAVELAILNTCPDEAKKQVLEAIKLAKV